ncbi:hypothetical protein C8R44DRAFT_725797 [Mycena epipterygia]|nr:hypothetical protein C8R44DRAFT_725797 [Mycena epipterygia]
MYWSLSRFCARQGASHLHLDLANGARGEIVDIVLDPDEPTIEDGPVVHLKKLQAYIYSRELAGLDKHIIPIELAQTTYWVKFQLPDGTFTQCTIRRRQFAITAAYAFTDYRLVIFVMKRAQELRNYRSQGQTIPYVLVDIATPPTGGLSLFNLYVALSRSSGRETIRLLRDFDDKLFMKSHDPMLLAEDDRLESLNEQTRRWWEERQSQKEMMQVD